MNTILFTLHGTAHCLWTEALPLQELGRLAVQRASTIEFNHPAQRWEVRLATAPEAVAFSHPSRETCLNWERNTLNTLLDPQPIAHDLSDPLKGDHHE